RLAPESQRFRGQLHASAGSSVWNPCAPKKAAAARDIRRQFSLYRRENRAELETRVMVMQDRQTSRSNGPVVPRCPIPSVAEPKEGARAQWHTLIAPHAALSAICVAGWVAVFTAGVTISSQPYRNLLDSGKSGLEIGMALLATLFTFTPPNVAILCCVSSVIGA